MNTIPTPALAAGYTQQTFGPDLEIGRNWFDTNFYRPPVAGQSIQNGDGTVYLPKGGNGYGICTAQLLDAATGKWGGVAFSGGFYVEAILSLPVLNVPKAPPWPGFWANPIEGMATLNAPVSGVQWPKQPWGTLHSVELDFCELDAQNGISYGHGMHDWYGLPPVKLEVRTTNPPVVITPQTFDRPFRIGFLTVPATKTTPGSASGFFNGVQQGASKSWALYDPTAAPPPLDGTSAYSLLDTLHYAPIIQTCDGNPLTVHAMSVWQASAAGNWHR